MTTTSKKCSQNNEILNPFPPLPPILRFCHPQNESNHFASPCALIAPSIPSIAGLSGCSVCREFCSNALLQIIFAIASLFGQAGCTGCKRCTGQSEGVDVYMLIPTCTHLIKRKSGGGFLWSGKFSYAPNPFLSLSLFLPLCSFTHPPLLSHTF